MFLGGWALLWWIYHRPLPAGEGVVVEAGEKAGLTGERPVAEAESVGSEAAVEIVTGDPESGEEPGEDWRTANEPD